MGLFKRRSSINVEGKTLGELNKSATTTPPKAPEPIEAIEVTPEYEEIKRLIDEGNRLIFVTGGAGARIPIALARDSKGIHAFSAECPHAGYIVKPQGSDEFICPAHNSLFSSKDGAVLRGPASYGLGIYPVTETGGEIFVTI